MWIIKVNIQNLKPSHILISGMKLVSDDYADLIVSEPTTSIRFEHNCNCFHAFHIQVRRIIVYFFTVYRF